VFGERPFVAREGDRAANFWPLAIVSFGESWHNLHHADPTCARHGALKGQVDITARVIWVLEKLGWVSDVRWPRPERLAAKRAPAAAAGPSGRQPSGPPGTDRLAGWRRDRHSRNQRAGRRARRDGAPTVPGPGADDLRPAAGAAHHHRPEPVRRARV